MGGQSGGGNLSLPLQQLGQPWQQSQQGPSSLMAFLQQLQQRQNPQSMMLGQTRPLQDQSSPSQAQAPQSMMLPQSQPLQGQSSPPQSMMLGQTQPLPQPQIYPPAGNMAPPPASPPIFPPAGGIGFGTPQVGPASGTQTGQANMFGNPFFRPY